MLAAYRFLKNSIELFGDQSVLEKLKYTKMLPVNMPNKLGAKQKEEPESYRKVLYYFFSFPEQPISLNDLARNVKISKTSAKSAVGHLINEGFLKNEVIGNAWRILPSLKHDFLIKRKIPYNLEQVYKSGIIELAYKKIPGARAIILFGSYRWGTDNEKSDIDIAVEAIGEKEMRIQPLTVIQNIGFRVNIKVNVHIFSRTAIDLNLFTNIANGIVLDGLLEVHP